jgi:hypothetical protein
MDLSRFARVDESRVKEEKNSCIAILPRDETILFFEFEDPSAKSQRTKVE